MSITVNCAIDLTEEELLFILRRRADHAIIDHTLAAATAAVNGNETPDSVSIPEERIEAVETVVAAALAEPPLLPPKPVRRASRVNSAAAGAAEAQEAAAREVNAAGLRGEINATPLAPPPPPEPLDEPAMRSLLSKVGAVHPLKVKAITNILENCGGARRLSECDPSTWSAIAEAALVALKEHSA